MTLAQATPDPSFNHLELHMGLRFIKIAVVYLFVGALLGMYMGNTAGPVVGVGASVVVVALALFMTNVLLNAKPAAA